MSSCDSSDFYLENCNDIHQTSMLTQQCMIIISSDLGRRRKTFTFRSADYCIKFFGFLPEIFWIPPGFVLDFSRIIITSNNLGRRREKNSSTPPLTTTNIQKHKYTNTQIQRQIRMMVVLKTSVYLSIRNILHNCAKYIQIQIQIHKYKYKYKYTNTNTNTKVCSNIFPRFNSVFSSYSQLAHGTGATLPRRQGHLQGCFSEPDLSKNHPN